MRNQQAPKEWYAVQIADISIKGQQRKPNSDESFTYIDIGSIDRDSKRISTPQRLKGEDAPSRARKVINSGDVLVSLTRPNLNAVALVTEKYDDQIASTGFEVIKPINVESRYIFALTRSKDFIDTISGVTQGALYPAAKSADVQAYTFLLPPLAEQKVIAEKLDTLLAQVEATKARLESTLQTLKQFRQSVLAAAVSGKLTEDWRKNNLTNERWEDISFHELILKVRSGSAEKPTDDVNGVPILRSSAVRPLSVDYSDVRYLDDVDNLKNENYLRNGDLLFTRLSGSAEYVGNCALVKGVENEYQYPDRLFCARLKDPTHAEYLEYFCSSDGFRQHIYSSIKSSAGHQRITLDVIKKAPISLPSRAEQEEIVIRIKKLFAGADATEQQVNQALERVDNLTQSILAKAFRGELTEQWRKENPELISGENSAEALLEKIKAERAAANPKRKTRKKAE
ncbi:restriction endonuclease subunit S [Vibrio alginolyticus]|uniref:restriction endonuclease subunit S n=1 Tax=Vibrio alginolyticus TaxID=663 RepID=UPI002FF1087C